MSATSTPSSYSGTSTGGLWATGVTAFAGVVLLMIAAFQIIMGIAAIVEDEVFVVGVEYMYAFDVTAWGWVHLAIGLAGAAIGLGMLSGQSWARVGGIAIAVITAIAQFAFLPYYPFWSIAIMAFSVLVIWALASQLAANQDQV